MRGATDHLERERGILSRRDREYLLGESDIRQGTQHERDVRSDIRSRIQNALLDFHLLVEHLEERDREQVFSVEGWRNVEDPQQLRNDETDGFPKAPIDAVDDVIRFVFLGRTDHNSSVNERDNGHHFPEFEVALKQGLKRGYWDRGYVLQNLDLKIESHRDTDDEMTMTKAAMLFVGGKLNKESYREIVMSLAQEETGE